MLEGGGECKSLGVSVGSSIIQIVTGVVLFIVIWTISSTGMEEMY